MDESVFVTESPLQATAAQSCQGNAETPSRSHPSEFPRWGPWELGYLPPTLPPSLGKHWSCSVFALHHLLPSLAIMQQPGVGCRKLWGQCAQKWSPLGTQMGADVPREQRQTINRTSNHRACLEGYVSERRGAMRTSLMAQWLRTRLPMQGTQA